MKLPTSLRIGPFDYSVEVYPLEIAAADHRVGACDRIRHVIKVRPGMSAGATG